MNKIVDIKFHSMPLGESNALSVTQTFQQDLAEGWQIFSVNSQWTANMEGTAGTGMWYVFAVLVKYAE